MEHLEKALNRGFKETVRLEKDEAFRELRERERSRLLLREER